MAVGHITLDGRDSVTYGITSLVESSAVGVAAAAKGRLTRKVMGFTLHKTLSVSGMVMMFPQIALWLPETYYAK